MFVSSPVFPISFELEQVTKLIEEQLHKKNWKEFEVAEVKLVLAPFYIFYYDAAIEQEKAGKRVVEETKRGKLALDALSGQLNQLLAESMPEEKELVKELPDTYPLDAKNPIFSKGEAKKIAALKTASLLKVAREDIVLSDFKMIYYPIWIAGITVAGENHELAISAVTGEIFGEEKVPVREKGFVEITKETLEELKQPKAWLRYTKEVGGIAAGKLKRREGGEKRGASRGRELPGLLRNPMLWITVALVIILAIVALYL